jgi:hypothetical protein
MTRLPNATLQLTLILSMLTVCEVAMADPIADTIGEIKPLIDVRARYEYVDQAPPPAALTDTANAVTVRARLGAETGKAWNTSLLLEGEFLTVVRNNYRSDASVPGHANYPVVGDPEAYEVNRFQFTNTSIANTTITVGRQRLLIDDQRFVGNSGWRMNEQTFDALRVVNKPFTKALGGNLTVDLTYLNRANRVFGPDSPQGAYKGDITLANVAYQFHLGKLTGFGYFLDFDPITNFVTGAGLNTTQRAALNPARVSSKTIGTRFAGTYNVNKIRLAYSASWANQKDFGSYSSTGRPHFSNDYQAAELIGTYRQYSLGAGFENLAGDGTQGFQTPLASLHKFQGWVDKFLSTPARGIDDQYVTAAYTAKGIAPFETVALTVVQHSYKSNIGGQNYGDEFNIQLAATWSRFTGTLKYGSYKIGSPVQLVANSGTVNNAFSTLADTKKFWAQIDFIW